MTDVVVSDSLTGRLEYIAEGAKTDRAATFTAVPNEWVRCFCVGQSTDSCCRAREATFHSRREFGDHFLASFQFFEPQRGDI